MEINRPVTQRTTPYKAFITQESYDKYSLMPSFTEYLEQATSLRLLDQRDTAQHTAQQASANDPNNKGAFSRGQNIDSCPAPVSHGARPSAVDSEIQFPRVSRISVEDQEVFLEEYRSILGGDVNKLELNRMNIVQELKSLILAEQEEFQQFAYQQARAHYEIYNMVPPDVKMAFEEDACSANKACVQDHPQYYSLHQTLGLSVGAVYKTDPTMQHEHTVLQLGNVPLLYHNVGRGMKLLGSADGVSGPRASSGINVTKIKSLSQDTAAFNLAKQLKVDVVIASEALKTLIDNQEPDYTEQWELPVCVEQLKGIEETVAGKPRMVICIDDPLPKKSLTPDRVNYDFYRRSLRRLVCQKQEGLHHNVRAEETTIKCGAKHPAPTLQQEDTEETTLPVESQETDEQRHLSQNTEDATTQGRAVKRSVSLQYPVRVQEITAFDSQDVDKQAALAVVLQSKGETTPTANVQDTLEHTPSTTHTEELPALQIHLKDFIKHKAATAHLQDTDCATPSAQFDKKDQHTLVGSNSRSKPQHSAQELRSQGRKRSAASAKHFQDEETDLTSAKLPRYEENMEHRATHRQVTSDATDSVVYTLWRFGKLKILVQSSLDAYKEDNTKPNKYTFFSVMPKLEYQPSLGYARLTPSETSRFWLHSYLRPNTRLLCGRINVHNSEVMKIDELEIGDILNSGLAFNPARGMKLVWQVLNCLSGLSEGKYLLSHAPRDIHCCLYRSVECETESARRSVYDLHQAHSVVGQVAPFGETEIPWAAVDTNQFLPKHIEENIIPCTFPAVPAKRLAELQAVEKIKEQKAQYISNPPKKGKRSKKASRKKARRDKAEDDRPQRANPATNPSAGNASRPSKARQQKKGPPGVQLLAHSSLDDVMSSCTDERSVSLSRRTMAPITYDDIDFGEL